MAIVHSDVIPLKSTTYYYGVTTKHLVNEGNA